MPLLTEVISDAAQRESARVSACLAEWIAKRDLSVRAVEHKLGWGHTTLSSAIKRHALKFSTVAAVAEACGFELADFYRYLAAGESKEPPKDSPKVGRKRRKEVVPRVPEDELMDRVRGVVKDWIDEQQKKD
jgi:hypothetical protein